MIDEKLYHLRSMNLKIIKLSNQFNSFKLLTEQNISKLDGNKAHLSIPKIMLTILKSKKNENQN